MNIGELARSVTLLAIALILFGMIALALFNDYRRPQTANRPPEYGDRATAALAGASPPSPVTPAPSTQGASPAVLKGHDPLVGERDVCRAPDGPDVGGSAPGDTFAWRDDQGVMNFSDTAPRDRAADRLLNVNESEDFRVTIRADAEVGSANYEGQVHAAAKRIYDHWADWLGAERTLSAQITVRLLADRSEFLRVRGNAGMSAASRGFYRYSTNEAVVLVGPQPSRRAFPVIFHELSHLISARQVGYAAPWFTEGLAEVFETMSVTGQYAAFGDAPVHRSTLRARGVVPISELVSLQRGEWSGPDSEHRYASAWALLSYLLSTDPGRESLRRIANAARDNRCALDIGIYSEPLHSYPGGIGELQRDLERWLAER